MRIVKIAKEREPRGSSATERQKLTGSYQDLKLSHNFYGFCQKNLTLARWGLLASPSLDDGRPAIQVPLIVHVLIRAKMITYKSYAPFQSNQGGVELLKKQKANVAAFGVSN